MSETLFELERATDRAEIAAVLGAFADAIGDDRAAVFGAGEDAIAVEVPDRTVLDVELEREDEPPTIELEFELEWDERPDEPTVRPVDAADRTPIAGAEPPSAGESDRPPEEEGTTADDTEPSAPSPASSVASPDAVAESDASTPDADVDVEPSSPGEDAAGRRSRFEVYRDRAGEWRWRLVHWNGNVIADSGEGYASRRNAERGLRSVMRNAPAADVEHRD